MPKSDLPNTRVPVEFLVKLRPNKGYSKRALLANVAKKGETEEYQSTKIIKLRNWTNSLNQNPRSKIDEEIQGPKYHSFDP